MLGTWYNRPSQPALSGRLDRREVLAPLPAVVLFHGAALVAVRSM